MQKQDLFTSFEQEFDESIRVDRELTHDERLGLLEDYHVTDEAHRFLSTLLAHIAAGQEGKRKGWNHWLHGYFGSGKSHLLAVTGHLLDTEWLDEEEVGRERAWQAFSGGRDLPALRERWREATRRFHLEPLFINLLKHQGRTKRGFGEVILESMYDRRGLSRRLPVAFFEEWYRDREAWDEREVEAADILEDVGIEPGDNPWEKVRRYDIASQLVLPELFEAEADVAEGLSDLTDRSLDQESVVERLQERRDALDDHYDRPVKLVLLLDEISLFIGTDHNLLTELNALAEQIDKMGEGDILSVVTAQERLSDSRIDFTGLGVSFSILNDRFPRQHQLPAGHVGEIVQKRLLETSDDGLDELEEYLDDSPMSPSDVFGYDDIERDLSPSLTNVDRDAFCEYFPLLPYHPPLFLEILSSIRERGAGHAKSVFSGTARAVLALVKGLIEEWVDSSERRRREVVNLVDFFDIVRSELQDVIPQKFESIKAIKEEAESGTLEPLDLEVAKVVMLLNYVKEDYIPPTPMNIATALIRTLDADKIKTKNEVGASLDRLDKYLRPEDDGTGFRFTTPEEQSIIESARRQNHRDWTTFCETLEHELWEDIVDDLDLPDELPYRTSEEDETSGATYKVRYQFLLDDFPLERNVPPTGELDVAIRIDGLLPSEGSTPPARSDRRDDIESGHVLTWTLPEDDVRRQDVRKRLEDWASLAHATQHNRPPESIRRDLDDKAGDLRRHLVSLLEDGTFEIHTSQPDSLREACRISIQQNYPDHYHPVMSEVVASDLIPLRHHQSGDSLPEWAETIEVPRTVYEKAHIGDVRSGVWKIAGELLGEHGSLSVSRLLDEIVEREPVYDGAREALVALLWGLCRLDTSRFWLADNVHLDRLLDPNHWPDVRIELGPSRQDLRERLEELEFVEAEDSLNDALVKLENNLRGLAQNLRGEEQDVESFVDDVQTETIEARVEAFRRAITAQREEAEALVDEAQSKSPDWFDVADRFEATRSERDTAFEIWETRRSYFVELDVMLHVGRAHLPWLDDEVRSIANRLDEQIQAIGDIHWWEDKADWSDFAGEITEKSAAKSALRERWIEYRNEADRASFAQTCEPSPWIQPAYRLPDQIVAPFRQTFIEPVLAFLEAYRDAAALMTPFMEASDDSDVWTQARNTDVDGDFSALEADHLERARSRVEALHNLVEGLEPTDIKYIAEWPDDEQLVRSYVTRAVTQGDAELDVHEHGVVLHQASESTP